MRAPLADRLWAKVDKNGPVPAHRPDLGPCWLWTGARSSKGYASIKAGRRTRPAHVVAYELVVGPVPDGLMLDHLCRRRECVNPGHVEPVTSRENTLRGDTLAARYAARTRCHQGHPLQGDNLALYVNNRPRPHRVCRACKNARERAAYRARRSAVA